MSATQDQRNYYDKEDIDNISLKFNSLSKENKVVTSQPDSSAIGDPRCDVTQTYDGIPGLQYLIAIDQLIVKKETSFIPLGCGCVTKSEYSINNSFGMFKYSAVEDNVCCTRNCCGIARSFNTKVLSFNESVIIHLHHELRCDNCCFPCCLQQLQVYAPPDNLLGSVIKEWSIGRLNLRIQTSEGVTIFKISGQSGAINCGREAKFKVYEENDKNHVGVITKHWSGHDHVRSHCDKYCKGADQFEITFPPHLDIKKKALLLGALFFIIQEDSRNIVEHLANYCGYLFCDFLCFAMSES